MIEELRITNFKGLQHIVLPLKRLTLLSGPNSAGKSSVLQAILLLQQLDWARGATHHSRVELAPRSHLVALGTGRDLLHEFAKEDELRLGYSLDKRSIDWVFHYEQTTGRLLTDPGVSADDLGVTRGLKLVYLGAERWGPRTTYPYEDTTFDDGLGAFGEFTYRYLVDHGDDQVTDEAVLHPTARGLSLLHQTAAWLSEISPGVRLDIQRLREAGRVLAGFGFERRGEVASRYYRAANVGFGLSYSISLIVALLTGVPGGVLLLENPEAHLHPRGQASLAALMTRASTRTQVIVETHSDHVMNGIRVAVKAGLIPSSDVAFHFLLREGVASMLKSPKLDAAGRLDFWPDGFFDQFDRDLAALVSPPPRAPRT